MRSPFLLSWLVGLIVLAVCQVSPAAPKKKQPEELSYTPPAGWERTEQERIVIFTPPGVAPTKCALIVTPGENLEGDFLKWFKAKWDALRQGAKTVQGGERTAMDGPHESSVMIQAALLESEAESGGGAGGAAGGGTGGGVKKRTGLLLYAANVGSAVHWVVFRTDGPELFNKHKKTVNQFLAGIKFVEIAPGPKSQPKPQPKPQPGKVRPTTPAARGGE